MIPPKGRDRGPLTLDFHSRAFQSFAAAPQVSVTGKLIMDLGVTGRYGSNPSKAVVATLAQAPVSGAGHVQSVDVINGPAPNQVTIECRDSANGISTDAALVNVVAYLGK